MVDMLAHFTSHLGPIRMQHDFLVLIHISKQDNSDSQACKRRCNSLTDGAISKMSSAYITTNELGISYFASKRLLTGK